MERRLAAILAADVVGYSRLMGEDEAGTLDALRTHREQLIEPKVTEHRGRIVKLIGDGLLAEFPSAVEAVQCAVEVQNTMHDRNMDVPENRRIIYRIGINIGDIVLENDDIFGDGVNVAARLEGLAQPGSICISGNVYEQLAGKTDITFEDAGKQTVKNILKPVSVWRWVAHVTGQASPELALPDKPSIVVLPFTNMSGDPEQEYFSDGITEDIITELSRFHSLFVIARNSSFHYKGQLSKVQDIGRELGVQYIVEGSVRKAGNRVRITAQLVEAASGNHLWAERYDRELDDIFAVQDEVVQAIASAVPGRLEEVAMDHARGKPSDSMTAYDHVLRAERLLRQDYGDPEAVAMLEKAIQIDPQSARAHSRLATLYAYTVFTHRGATENFVRKAQSHAEIAILIEDGDPVIHAATAITYSLLGNHDLAGRHIQTAIALNPNDAMIMYYAGVVLSYLGNHTEGLQWYKKAVRLDPHFADALREGMFYANYLARRYDDAIELFRGWRKPAVHMLAHLAAAYAQAGRRDEARAAAAEFDRVRPKDLDIVAFAKGHADGFARKDDGNNWLEGYRKAGLLK